MPQRPAPARPRPAARPPRPGRACALALLLWCAAGCAADLDPQSLVDGFRVLAVRAEPPDAAPGTRVTLDALVVDPAAAAPPPEALWLACAPPIGGSAVDCSALLAGATPGPCDPALEQPVCIVGAGPVVELEVPASAAEELVITHLAASGSVGLAACAEGIAASGAPPLGCVASIKRIGVLAPGAPGNRNPTVVSLAIDGAASGDRPVTPDAVHRLALTLASDAAEPLPEGAGALEELLVSWFATAGEVDRTRTEADPPEVDWTAPAAATAVRIFGVVRDGRGGVGFAELPVRVGDLDGMGDGGAPPARDLRDLRRLGRVGADFVGPDETTRSPRPVDGVRAAAGATRPAPRR